MIVRGMTGNVEVRTTLADLGIPSRTQAAGGSAGQLVTGDSVLGIPAFNRALQIGSQAVAKLCFGCFRGQGADRQRVTTTWQSRLLDAPTPLQPGFEWRETIQASLMARGNAYLWKNIDPRTGRVVELVALHPDQVGVFRRNGRKAFQVAVGLGYVDPTGNGSGFYSVDESTILHIKGFGGGGLWVAPSPVALYRAALGSALAQFAHEASLYERGATVRLAIVYPDTMDAEAVEEWREVWRETYEGSGGQRTAVLGGGAQLKEISLTQADAQFVESRQLSVVECARIAGLPASIIDGGQRSAASGSAPITPEHEEIRFKLYSLTGWLARIAEYIGNDPDLFGPGSSVEPGWDIGEFDVAAIDFSTKAGIAKSLVQAGIWVPDEARAMLGAGPLPNGVGQIVQITPVGGQENPDAPAPAPAPDQTTPPE